MWGLLRLCAACRTSRLKLSFELRPSWNNIHDTFPTGTVQDTTLTVYLFHKPFHRVIEIIHETFPLIIVSDTDVQYYWYIIKPNLVKIVQQHSVSAIKCYIEFVKFSTEVSIKRS
jgi:hypothetical protein